ncbi:MAG TPA: RNase adapter RapZ [Methylophilaceae bacterium]|nr:RNase adapter RapZ [Methylophilaceae bacterium]
MHLIIITGLSGSGKSVALRALEDSGFYCIDNLPATMLPLISHHVEASLYHQVAISIDSRSASLESLPSAIDQLRSSGSQVDLLFLESNVETLVNRFSETRRKHPLSDEETTLAESIVHERELLSDLSHLSCRIDTSNINANTLRNYVRELIKQPPNKMSLLFTSFGFKKGIPLDADLVFDVRSLPNPHYDKVLRPLTGKDEPVISFLRNTPMALEMLVDIQQYIEKWLSSFEKDNRSYLTVAIGCTGGQHRSVYFVEELSRHFKKSKHKVIVRHRELDK